jgi:uncharacterized membrane protein YfcA
MDYLLYLGLGALAGLISGLLGLGGGVVIVPILILSFEMQGMAPEISTHVAIGTSLATILVTSLSSIYTHHQNGAIKWNWVVKISPGILFGSLLGGLIALALNGNLLQLFFGGFLVLISLQILFYTPTRRTKITPSSLTLGIAGISIGSLSALVGIGGGSLTAPFLSYNGFKFHHAVGTAAVCGFPIAFVATLVYVSASIPMDKLPSDTLGYIFIPAWLGIVLTSMPFARFGALLAHRINERLLKQLFAGIILILGLRFIWLNAVTTLG